MAASLLALLDDIATLLEDVGTMSHLAVKKTAGVLGDDLALNAKQVTGLDPSRELPVVWKVGVGSLLNKAILVPAAIGISAIVPWAIKPLLVLGGIYLCYEGVEKLAHRFLHPVEADEAEHSERIEALANPAIDMVAFEKERIQGAIRTDFVLSAEIIVISLGTVADAPLLQQLAVLVAISLIMTVGVYGLVAGIVKLDDIGMYLSSRSGSSWMAKLRRSIGMGLLWMAPALMKFLSVAGTVAMFLVGGGIILHGLPFLADPIHHFSEWCGEQPFVGSFLPFVATSLLDLISGLVSGAIALGLVTLAQKFSRA